MRTTNSGYGTGHTVEKFMNKEINRRKNLDLKPQDRKPRKKGE